MLEAMYPNSAIPPIQKIFYGVGHRTLGIEIDLAEVALVVMLVLSQLDVHHSQ